MKNKSNLPLREWNLSHGPSLNIFVMDEQKKRAQEIWEINIDKEIYIYDPDEISDKLALIESGTVL